MTPGSHTYKHVSRILSLYAPVPVVLPLSLAVSPVSHIASNDRAIACLSLLSKCSIAFFFLSCRLCHPRHLCVGLLVTLYV